MKLQPLLTIGLAILACGCGRMGDLEPIPGQEPIEPLMAKATPTADELLAIPPYARPDRVDELIRRSQARQSDPFDLPPPTGSAAPPAPAGTDPEPINNETGPPTPQ
jgi:hypothetical protein